MIRTAPFLIASIWLAAVPSFARLQCSEPGISVVGDRADAPHICELASRAIAELATCSVPLDRPILIEIFDTLPDGRIGQYHPGEDRIDLLSPGAAQAGLETGAPMSLLDPDAFQYSILVHELTHAALDDMPCPFPSCYATQEYVAYAMQMRSLSADARATLLTRPEFNRPIAADEINQPVVLFAPDVFMQKAWLHFSQQADPCGFIAEVASWQYLFDREMN